MLEQEWVLSSRGQASAVRVQRARRRTRGAVLQVRVFWVVAIACLLFLVFTGLSMAMFPGGTLTDSHTHGYKFFQNFLSDLGQTQTSSGASNYRSMVFFMLAMLVAAVGVPLFFSAFRQFLNASRMTRLLSRGAVYCSLMTAMSFVGIAACPWNLYYRTHIVFVEWACCSFGVATALEMIAITCQPRFPRAFLWAFGAFAAIIGAYLVLWVLSPPRTTATVELIEATGQKVVIYGSIVTLLGQTLLVKPLLLSSFPNVTSVARRSRRGALPPPARSGSCQRVADRRLGARAASRGAVRRADAARRPRAPAAHGTPARRPL